MSPYRGQVQHIKDVSRAVKGTPTAPVTTILHKAQGAECKVGISTTASNDEGNVAEIGFIYIQEVRNVRMSRHQRFHSFVSPWTSRQKLKLSRDKFLAD